VTPFGKKRRRTWKCELLFGWLKRPVKLVLSLQAKMELLPVL
jgi:hypothetical protein